MSKTLSVGLSRAWQASRPTCMVQRTTWRFIQPITNAYSTTSQDATPPFLDKLKGELKSAMRAKDTPRLNVLRAIMSANLNASKTSQPIKTDVQLVALIRKMQKGAQETVSEAQNAGRQDLVDKETQQIRIMDEFLASSGVESLGEAELKALVQDAVEASKSAGVAAKSLLGDVMKRLAAALEGKDVDRKQLSVLVKELTGQ